MFKSWLLGFLLIVSWTVAAEPRKPNLVFILSDNHGAWTLGCYGNKEIRTPNIDRLAAEGTLFTRAYCANPVCSPSRATYLTGLMPSQHGVHSYLPPDKQNSPSGPEACVINEFPNLPKILSRAGYECGLVGKWHLGGSLQPQQGFSYWLTKSGGHTTTFYRDEMVWHARSDAPCHGFASENNSQTVFVTPPTDDNSPSPIGWERAGVRANFAVLTRAREPLRCARETEAPPNPPHLSRHRRIRPRRTA